MIRIRYIVMMIVAAGCVDPYQFRVADQTKGIGIEAYLSNKSANDSRSHPSDVRYAYVKLSRTSDVINTRSERISGAQVILESYNGEQHHYTEASNEPGLYHLLEDDFRAEEGIQYRIVVNGVNDQQITSDWQSLPAAAQAMGDISFRETTVPRRIVGQVIERRGIIPQISIPENNSGQPIYYRWTILPTWVFVAPRATTAGPNNRCWATSIHYMPNFALQEDNYGGYEKDFYFIDTDENERILHDFSLLVEQQVMSGDYYYFWKEMQELSQTDGIFSVPPYNLRTNYTSAGDVRIVGYFGIVRSEVKRWYFNRQELSYAIPDWFIDVCNEPCIGCPPPACVNCMSYDPVSSITNQKPIWWSR